MREYINDSRYVQHFLGFLLMYSLVATVSKLRSQTSIVAYSAIGYLLFTLSTKLDLPWNLAIVGMLIVSYLYEQKMHKKEQDSDDDPALEDNDKKRIVIKHKINKYIMMIGVAAVIAIGTSCYYKRKKVQYGGAFDVNKYVFG